VIDGLLLVDKPSGCTSHDVVQFVRWALHERAIGHTGTLDPPATGLLVMLVGGATRLAPWLAEHDKRYRARIVLGRSTTTDDAEGDTVASAPCDDATLARAAHELAGLVGALELAPPAVSAIHVDGRRAHARVRAGEIVELPPKAMRVDAIAIESIDREAHAIDAVLDVGTGTYVRTIAAELGRRVGVPAHLGALRRLTVGDASVDDPRVAAELVAHSRPGGGAIVEHRDLGRDRTAVGAWLRTRILDPLAALLDPVVRLEGDDARIGRLAVGQALAAVDLPELGGAGAGWIAGPDVLVRVEVDPIPSPGRRVAARPVRVIRWNAPGSPARSAPPRQGGEMP
jgi:tRNA pseudouridine(55) synthase